MAILNLALFVATDACTNFMVSPGASVDGSAIFSYSCDGPAYASLSHYAARKSASPGKRLLTRSGCSQEGPVRGEVDDVEETYNVVGLTNEHQVAIGETTFGGLHILKGTGMLTYYDVMELALQRSKTARDMIFKMDSLIHEYGYGGTAHKTEGGAWGTGESYTIADKTEVWHMEMIGKGNWSTGAVWVAQRVPDGYVGGHANQARITSFPLDDKENCLYSEDVIDFAVEVGLYPPEAPKDKFSFADAYDPMTWSGARHCDARVWSFFSQVAEPNFEKRYEQYAMGNNLTDRMPLFVKAAANITVQGFMNYMRGHYEGTALDNREDVSSGGFHSVFRNSPSTWKSGGNLYTNERHPGVPYAATHYVAQLRGWLPDAIGAINWFSVDDASFSVHAPFRASATRVSKSYTNAIGGEDVFSFDSAFWVFNMVANFAYYRYSEVAPVVASKIAEYETNFAAAVQAEDEYALTLWSTNHSEAVEFLTAAGEARGNNLVHEWLMLYQQLFMQFRDGQTPQGVQSGYAQDWYDRVAKETGERYMIPESVQFGEHDLNDRKMAVLSKSRTFSGSTIRGAHVV